MRIAAALCCIFLAATLAFGQSETPKRNYVPDSATAVKIAEAVLIPVYGQEKIESERPFTAKLTDNVWIVSGTVWCFDSKGGKVATGCIGGAAEVRISKVDGRILGMIHYK